MDINFSQIGQNIAAQEVPLSNAVKLNEQTPSSVQQTALSSERDSQERQESADNKSDRSPNSVDVESAVSEISDFLQTTNRQLSFSIDEKSERQVVKVTDSESGEVIRQIPSEEVLALSERIKELQSDVGSVVGVLFNKQA